MSWIREIDESEAGSELAAIYEDLVSRRGKVANIMKVHSLNPGAMQRHMDLYMHIMFGRSGLSRAEREAIAVVVSAANHCPYCVNHHAEALERYEKDEARLAAIRAGGPFDGLPPRLAAMLAHASALTRAPGESAEAAIDQLRAGGLTDDDILDVTLVVAYFNFVNRIALGLGVEFSADEMTGYRT